ncbi:beta-galactosidase GalA [Marinilabilia salmonicolor]|uniref:beta-galactosidase GalA n=2 Tax=Marinilabilia salmonicolor TaxID=989 RepID=UPI00029B358B|nr:beta-galactosidase GalA [Marinilabilia salmonicolor]
MKTHTTRKILLLLFMVVPFLSSASPRERLLMNFDWQFTFGHPHDVEKDFNMGTSYFTYLAKAGYGDGAAAADFDDRTWRTLDLPHDWAAEMEFSGDASHSHGYKKVGPGFPDTSVGWYRKTFSVSESDKGKRIFLEFDGVFRDSKVWVNGFYCGNEPSGYTGFSYDVSEYLNYGGENVVAVRVDASMEEGWFYEGAGIYRHVWMTKVNPLHVPQYGTFVTSEVDGDEATVTARVTVRNKNLGKSSFSLENRIVNAAGDVVAEGKSGVFELIPMGSDEYTFEYKVDNPHLWDLDDPHLYTLETLIHSNDQVVDKYETTFGIRTIKWDPDKGFFLNGRHVKIKGTNNHQNHAGVGTAIPDGLHEWRLKQLKDMGNNAYRTAHYPPTPALLEACDRMGMLVLNENRLMGTTDYMLEYLKRLVIRDRNHPSVVLWSIGNEEWMIENGERGAMMAQNMQAYLKTLDTTRPANAAVSGAWGAGISSVIEVMGFNYLRHGSTDEHHEKFPWQASLGTEQGSTNTTRGIYVDDQEKQYLKAYDVPTPSGFMSIQQGWQHYADRDYLAGMVIWTGFDYRGESTPFRYPSVLSYFGMFDLCGLPKDNVWYLKSWWSDEDVLHILPHWNWEGREGDALDVWVYSNHDEVELFANGTSFGRKKMEPNSHLEWKVPYKAGQLKAVAYDSGKKVDTEIVETTGESQKVRLVADRQTIDGDREDVAIVTVQVTDKKGRVVPTANRNITFEIEGPGKIIGVGNGDPTSHEPDRYIDAYKTVVFNNWKQTLATESNISQVLNPDFDVQGLKDALNNDGLEPGTEAQKTVFIGQFDLSEEELSGDINWMFRSIGDNPSLYVNGQLIEKDIAEYEKVFHLKKDYLKAGINRVVVVATPYVKENPWSVVNTEPGKLQVVIPAEPWQRKTFNGLAQVIIQSTGGAGEIKLTGNSDGLKTGELIIEVVEAEGRPAVK